MSPILFWRGLEHAVWSANGKKYRYNVGPLGKGYMMTYGVNGTYKIKGSQYFDDVELAKKAAETIETATVKSLGVDA